jgi:hypothetical protein
MSKEKKWQRFEALAADIQKQLSPDARVTLNDRVPGKHSKVFRQIDIGVRQKVGQFDVFIAIDCKDYKRNVNIKDVEAFVGLAKDVEANRAAIVSATGFSRAAKNCAEGAGIDLFRLVDTGEHDWQSYLSIPVVCDFRRMRSAGFEFSAKTGFKPFSEEPTAIPLFDDGGNLIDTTGNLLCKKWNAGLLPIEPGHHTDILLSDVATFIRVDQGLLEVTVTAVVNVERCLYFGQLRLAEMRGFEDQIKGGILTQRFRTADIDVVEVQKEWRRIESEEDLAVRPFFSLVATDVYPISEVGME